MNKHGHLKLTLFSIWATNVLLLVKNLSLLPSHVVAFTVMNSLKFFRVGGFHKRLTYKSFAVAKFHNNARRENLFCLICSPSVFNLSREDGNRSILGMLKVALILDLLVLKVSHTNELRSLVRDTISTRR